MELIWMFFLSSPSSSTQTTSPVYKDQTVQWWVQVNKSLPLSWVAFVVVGEERKYMELTEAQKERILFGNL